MPSEIWKRVPAAETAKCYFSVILVRTNEYFCP